MEPLEDILGKKIIGSATLSAIQEKIKSITDNPPTITSVHVILNDNAALKHEVCKHLIMLAANVSEEVANWYIVRAGTERELERLATIAIKPNEETKNTD
jgi:hypothetical protein